VRTLFEIKDFSARKPGSAAMELERFSLTLAPGETVVLLGEAGCGKDAVLRLLGGSLERGEEISGTIRFGENDPIEASRRLRGPLRVAYIPAAAQHPLSPQAVTAQQLVRVIAHRLNCPQGAAREELRAALGRLTGAPAIGSLDRLPGELDTATLSWSLLAAAIAATPELILCDHSFADISPVAARTLTDALLAAQAKLGFAIVYAARIPQVVARLGGRTIILQRGRVVEEGEAAHMISGQTHSYTRSLFHALPQPDTDKLRRTSVRGEPLLQVQGLALHTEKAKVRTRDTISFELRRGASLALVGEDGSGRRGLARAVLGLDRRPGRILFDAVDLNLLSEAMTSRLHRRIAFVTSADDALDPRMTLWDAVDEPLRAYLRLSRDLTTGYREAALKRVGLASYNGRRPVAVLTPFDRRRLQIARAIVAAPLLVVVDEPLRGLDAIARATTRDLLAEFRVEQQAAFLVITGDFAVARALADDVMIFHDGRVVERGTVREVLRAPKEAATRTLIEAAEFGPLPRGAEAV
jgi:peptide/nickel transport system ATP-binding protein